MSLYFDTARSLLLFSKKKRKQIVYTIIKIIKTNNTVNQKRKLALMKKNIKKNYFCILF